MGQSPEGPEAGGPAQGRQARAASLYTLLTRQLDGPPEGRRWWGPYAVCALCAAAPYLLCDYLPLVDFPLHQLELGVWLDSLAGGQRHGQYYALAPYSLPYWTTSALGGLFAQLVGVEAGARLVLALYVALLPLAARALCRAAGRSGWWGLSLAPFTYEFNLSWGFTAYCFAGMLLLWLVAASLRAQDNPGGPATWGALAVGLLLGWTHPQVAAVGAGLCVYLALFAGTRRARAHHLVRGVACFALPALWLATDRDAAADNFGGGIQYEAPGVLLRRLGTYTVDTLPGPLEEGLLLCVLALVGASWIARRERLDRSQGKLLAIPLTCLAMYFVAPFNLAGQAVCQRMPYLALLFMPLLFAPKARPARGLQALLVGVALLGTLGTTAALFGFDREARDGLEAMTRATPGGERLLYVPYAPYSRWVHAPAYAHAGAWLTLRRGGVYATNFDRLTVRYRPEVDRKGTIMGHEYALYSHFARTGEMMRLKPAQVPYWTLHLTRAPSDRPVSPVVRSLSPEAVLGFWPPWTLTRAP